MADPKIAKKKWKEFYIGVYKVLELHVGSDEVTVAFFYSYTFDPTSSRATNYYCPYFFLQSTSAAAGQFLDTFSMDDEALFSTNNPRGAAYAKRMAYSYSVLATAGATKFVPISPIGLDELTGGPGHGADGRVSFIVQRRDKSVGDDALIRFQIDVGPKGKTPYTFMIPVHQRDLPTGIDAHPSPGRFLLLSGVVTSLGEAETRMDNVLHPYLAGPKPPPLINLPRLFELRH